MNNDEEYRLPEETEGEYKTIPPELIKKPNGFAGLIKRIAIILAVLVLLFGTYKLIKSIWTKRGAVPKVSTQPQMPAVLPLTSQGFPGQQTPGVDARVTTLEAANAENKVRLEKVEANVAEIQNTMSTMTSQLTAINNTLQDLSQKVTDQAALVIKLSSAPKVAKPVVATPRKTYYVQAAIPGRAWLKTGKNGEILTVRIGDNIPGLGMVEGIDPGSGVITTSSGESIQFRSDES